MHLKHSAVRPLAVAIQQPSNGNWQLAGNHQKDETKDRASLLFLLMMM